MPFDKNLQADQIDRGLKEVSFVIDNKIKSKNKKINTICDHLKLYKGKMLRPKLCLIVEKIFSGNSHDCVVKTAASIEMIHLATLVHDDILDRSEKRRGAETLFSMVGSDQSVLFGDWLLSNAYHLCSTINNPTLNTRLGEVTNSLCEGQIQQMCSRDEDTLEEEGYMDCISKKTASLVSASCDLASLVSGASGENQKNARLFGHHLGMAFQIIDDVLDFVGETSVLGKQIGLDLVQDEWTLPLIVFHQKTGISKKEARGIFKKSTQDLLDEMKRVGTFDTCYDRAEKEVFLSKGFLNRLPDGEWVDYLEKISSNILKRRF